MEQKPSAAVAVFSGLTVLLTGPLALLALLFVTHSEYEGPAASLAELWNESGINGYVVLAAAAVASLGAAVLLGLSVRRPVLGVSALALFVLPMGAAVFGTSSDVTATLQAISHASPADQAVILLGSLSEVMAIQVQALAFATAACLSISLACFLSLLTAGRGPRLVAALGTGTLGLSLGSSLFQQAELRGAFKAIARLELGDRMTILVGSVLETAPASALSLALLLASVVMTGVGVAVLVRGPSRAAAISLAFTFLVAVVGLRGANALIEQQQLGAAAAIPPPQMIDLVPFRVGGMQHSEYLALPTMTDLDHAVVRGLGRRDLDEDRWVAIALEPAATRAQVTRALQVARFANANVDLVGGAPSSSPLEVPAKYRPLVDVLRPSSLALTVRVLFTDEVCERCDATATAVPEGLSVKLSKNGTTEVWKDDGVLARNASQLAWVDFTWTGDLAELARATEYALEHQHVLAIRVPAPNPEPEIR